jgi:PKD repeat protein
MGLVAPRLAVASSLAVLLLALGAANAHAVTYDFTVSPPTPTVGEAAVFQLTPTSAAVNRVRWDLDGDGDFDDGTTRTVTRSYADPGPVTIRMRARETRDDRDQTVTKTITVNARPAADFGFTPTDPMAGQAVAFTPSVSDPEGDAVTLTWDFGDGTGSSTGAPSHSFDAAGSYDVVLTATDQHGASTTVTHPVTVAADPGPTPAFGYTPSAPMAGDAVTFTSTSTPSQGSISTTEWDFDGDGAYEAAGAQVVWSFAESGAHTVAMRVTQENGKQAVAFSDVNVAERPPPDPGPTDPGTSDPGTPAPDGAATVPGGGVQVTTPKPRPATLMRPFPVIRIAGVVLPHGARVTILSVRAARGASVLVRCRGRGCPTRAVARSRVARLVRFHRFERRLPAGVTLELFVRKGAQIGKYTRFRIRGGKPPARVDRCLMPGSNRPVRCP